MQSFIQAIKNAYSNLLLDEAKKWIFTINWIKKYPKHQFKFFTFRIWENGWYTFTWWNSIEQRKWISYSYMIRPGLNPWIVKIPLEKGTATHSSILAWRIPWTEEPGRLQPMGLQSVRHDWAAKHSPWSAGWFRNIITSRRN